MNNTITILTAALTFTAPKMADYRQAWQDSDQTEADAVKMVGKIKADFKRLTSTDHQGMARLMDIPCVTYRTPTFQTAANTGVQVQYVKS